MLNKILPDFLLERGAADAARVLTKKAEEVAAVVAPVIDGASPAHLTHVLGEVGASFLDYQVVARREAEQRKGLASIPDLCLTVPYFDEDIHSLEGLLRLGRTIWR